MGLEPRHVLLYVVRPALRTLAVSAPAVEGDAGERLVMGTGAHESNRFRYLHQLGKGPALGLWQMEPATYADIWGRWLCYRPRLVDALCSLAIRVHNGIPPVEELTHNLRFAAAMCRVHYLRVPVALPAKGEHLALARYWKDHYNTYLGAGTPEEFLRVYKASVLPLYAQDSERA